DRAHLLGERLADVVGVERRAGQVVARRPRRDEGADRVHARDYKWPDEASDDPGEKEDEADQGQSAAHDVLRAVEVDQDPAAAEVRRAGLPVTGNHGSA